MVPSILVNAAQGSKLVIGGAGGELITSAVAQVSLGTPGWKGPSPGSPGVLLLGQGRGWGSGSLRPSLPQAIINKLWLGFDLRAAIVAPILHVDDKGQVEYEPGFSQVRPRPRPPPGGTPWWVPLRAPAGIPGTEYLRPGTPQLWDHQSRSSVGGSPGQPCGLQSREQGDACPRQSASAP